MANDLRGGATFVAPPLPGAETPPGSIDETIRNIVRAELERALGEFNRPRPTREWLSMTELSEQLGVSLSTIHQMVERGCPHIMPGTKPRFRMADVEAWAREQAQSRRRGE